METSAIGETFPPSTVLSSHSVTSELYSSANASKSAGSIQMDGYCMYWCASAQHSRCLKVQGSVRDQKKRANHTSMSWPTNTAKCFGDALSNFDSTSYKHSTSACFASLLYNSSRQEKTLGEDTPMCQ